MSKYTFTGKICPECGDKIYEDTQVYFGREFRTVFPCTCEKIKRAERERRETEQKKAARKQELLEYSKMPKLFHNSTFDNYESNCEEKNTLKKYANNFKKFYESGKGVLITGNCGSGKTHLACAVAHEVMSQDYGVLFAGVGDVYDETTSNYGVLPEKYEKATLLILDDFGIESKTESNQATLYKLIDRRYRNMKPTIITSNLSFGEIDKNFSPRISDRIYQNTFKLQLVAESYRRRKDKR